MTGRKEKDLPIDDFVHEPVYMVNATRPATSKLAAKTLGFSDASTRIA